ncbi:hypothetical protein [Paraburkholderia terrae]|uniref:hypothetical protein n=1 Tax=Paraburkholderia terrae TaxID=311230 RepID=UPI0033659113
MPRKNEPYANLPRSTIGVFPDYRMTETDCSAQSNLGMHRGIEMRRAKRFRQNRGVGMKAIEHDCASGETLRMSAHEIATPLLLLHASVELIAATPDVISLRESELVHLVESEQGQTMFAITDKGNPVLRILDARRVNGVGPSPTRPYQVLR